MYNKTEITFDFFKQCLKESPNINSIPRECAVSKGCRLIFPECEHIVTNIFSIGVYHFDRNMSEKYMHNGQDLVIAFDKLAYHKSKWSDFKDEYVSYIETLTEEYLFKAFNIKFPFTLILS